jgi:4'-phosphopantetheinyl transferase
MSPVKIINRHLENISWNHPAVFDFIIHNKKVDIWRINVTSHLSLLNAFLLIMSPEEIDRANSFYQTKDKYRYITAHGTLRNILAKYLHQSPGAIRFLEGANKKPCLINQAESNLFFNISYAGDWILLAVANLEIGVDVETINPRLDYLEITQKNFSAEEADYINADNSTERFFLLWTRKEALLKATGKGLDDYLKLIPGLDGIHLIQNDIISSGNNWQVSSFKIMDRYIASIAINSPANETRFWNADANL